MKPALIALLCIAAPPVLAQYQRATWPDQEPQITSAIMSRTTITVQSIEDSLRLYRDILGMTVFYTPKPISDPRLQAFAGIAPDQQLRLVVLRTETAGAAKLNAGYLGLAQILEADGAPARLERQPAGQPAYGNIGLLFVAEAVWPLYEEAKAAGLQILLTPTRREDGSYSQLGIRGPSGERLWITQSETRSILLQRKPD